MSNAEYSKYTSEKLKDLEQKILTAKREGNKTESQRLKKQLLVRKERLRKRMQKTNKL